MNILKKWIGADQVDDTKILLRNAQYLRGRNAANNANINLLRVSASDIIEFASLPQFSGSSLATQAYVASAVAAGGAAFVAHAAHGASNVTIANPGTAVFDGRTLTTGMYLFLFGQSNQQENGPWVFDTSSTPLVRPVGWTNTTVLAEGRQVQIDFGGTLYGNTLWALRDGGTVGTNNLVFDQFAADAANKTLSNLTGPTSINQDLLADSNGSRFLGSDTLAWAGVYTSMVQGDGADASAINMVAGNLHLNSNTGGDIQIRTSDQIGPRPILLITNSGTLDADVASGYIELSSSPTTGTGVSGAIDIHSGGAEDGDSGSISIKSGNASNSNSGEVRIESGTAAGTTFQSGQMVIGSGASDDATNPSGQVVISSGNNPNGPTGHVNLVGGSAVDADSTGEVRFEAYRTALATGVLQLKNLGADPTDLTTYLAGDMYYNTTSNVIRYYNGTTWASLSAGGGANTALSNLTTTSINQNLLPDADGTRSLGSSTLGWNYAYMYGFSTPGANATAVNLSSGFDVTAAEGTVVQLRTNDPAAAQEIILYTNVGGVNVDTNSGQIRLQTMDTTGTGASGPINLTVGNVVDGASGQILLQAGNASGTGSGGDLNLQAGGGADGNAGGVTIQGGGSSGIGAAGSVNIYAGAAGTGPGAAGQIEIRGGQGVTGVDGGQILIQAGAGNASDAGDLLLYGGDASGPGETGSVILKPGTVLGGGATSGFIKLQANSPTVGWVWTATNADGSGEWASASANAANKALSNLASVAINTDLIFGTGVTGLIRSAASTGSTADMNMGTGASTSGNSGSINVITGQSAIATGAVNISTGTGTDAEVDTGDVNISTGASIDGASGGIEVRTGVPSGTGTRGDVVVDGRVVSLLGDIQIYMQAGGSGIQMYTVGPSAGAIQILTNQSGLPIDTLSGNLNMATGAATGTGGSGGAVLETGTTEDGNSGDVSLVTGIVSGSGVRGAIIFQDGSEGTAGHVWTSTGVNGQGTWSAAGAAANQTLSNLSSPTAINQDLIFDKGATAGIQTKDDPNTVYELVVSSGTAINVDGAPLTVRSGSSNLGTSGALALHSGDQNDNNFIASGDVTLRSGHGATSGATGSTGSVFVASGNLQSDAAAGNSGALSLLTGGIFTSTGATGAISMLTGDAGANSAGGTGAISIATGIASGSGASGQLNIATGTGNISPSGALFISTGITGGDDTTDTGMIQITTGDASAGANTGNLVLRTGDLLNSTDNNKESGNVQIYTGNATDADSGHVRLFTGNHSGTGTKGKVKIENSTVFQLASLAADPANPQAGDQYYNTTSNSIRWYNGTTWASLSSGSGANTSLSNLASVAINTDLIFDSGSDATISTKNDSVITNGLQLRSGDSSADASGNVLILTGQAAADFDTGYAMVQSNGATGTGNSGAATLKSGTAVDGASGAAELLTGNSTNGNSGSISISTGTAGTGSAVGDINITTPNSDGGGGGVIYIRSGTNGDPNQGALNLGGSTITAEAATRFEVWDGAYLGLGVTSGPPPGITVAPGDMHFDDSSGVANYYSNGGGGEYVELWPKKPIKETITLVSGDITNQYIDLAHIAHDGSIMFMVRGSNGPLWEGASYEYTVSYTGGAGGNTRITFLNDIATGGPSALVAGDVLQICYLWNFQ